MPTPGLNLTRHQLDTVHIHPDSISRTLTKAALPAKMRIAAPLVPAVPKGKSQRRGRKPRRTGHNLLLRLANRKQDVLRFLSDLAVPFTNNQAERDARMMKVKQKISGGFRCIAGATDFATIRSFIATAKKQGWNVIQAIAQEPKVLVNSLRIA